ncbi:MAG: hypothetical protein AAF392_01435 [Bacteroidota bacterium]
MVQKLCYAHLSRHVKKASKALKRLRTLAGRQVRDLSRNLERVGQLGVYEKPLRLMARIVKQGRKSKEKVYSLSLPEESCIGKGKVDKRKQYELSSKVSLATLPGSQVVFGVEHFTNEPHDSKILSMALALLGRQFGRNLVAC